MTVRVLPKGEIYQSPMQLIGIPAKLRDMRLSYFNLYFLIFPFEHILHFRVPPLFSLIKFAASRAFCYLSFAMVVRLYYGFSGKVSLFNSVNSFMITETAFSPKELIHLWIRMNITTKPQ